MQIFYPFLLLFNLSLHSLINSIFKDFPPHTLYGSVHITLFIWFRKLSLSSKGQPPQFSPPKSLARLRIKRYVIHNYQVFFNSRLTTVEIETIDMKRGNTNFKKTFFVKCVSHSIFVLPVSIWIKSLPIFSPCILLNVLPDIALEELHLV